MQGPYNVMQYKKTNPTFLKILAPLLMGKAGHHLCHSEPKVVILFTNEEWLTYQFFGPGPSSLPPSSPSFLQLRFPLLFS